MTWVAKNNGLSGSELNVNYILINPATAALGSANHNLFIATDAGVFQSFNGGDSWSQINLPDPSNAEFNDDPAATVDELTFHWIGFDPTAFNNFCILAAKDSVERVWIYKTTDRFVTWTSRGVDTS